MFFYLSLFLWVIRPYNLLASETSKYYFPLEWETHDRLWVGVRTSKEGANYEPVIQKMLLHLANHVHLNLVIESSNKGVKSPISSFNFKIINKGRYIMHNM